MSLYLDASVVVPLFLKDALSARAFALMRAQKAALVISDWAGLEVSSVVARQMRIGALTKSQAEGALANFDLWRSNSACTAETSAADIADAAQFVRRLDVTWRGPDAVHLAIARRVGAIVCTFEARMETAALALGLAVA